MPPGLRAVSFDVLETLLDLKPMGARLEEIGQPATLLYPWFLRCQRDALCLAVSETPTSFPSVARQALRTATEHTADESAIDHVLAGFGTLPAHPDAEPALRKLAGAGIPVGCLTVGSRQVTEQFLQQAGLAPYVRTITTAEQAGIWKPAAGLYQTAAADLGVMPEEMALVAVHAWDCHGAKHARCPTGWCARLEGHYGDVFTPPDVTGRDLVEVVDGLLELPGTG
ncbi:HAD-IA family hydrolase [Parasphingorhabdus pacifica]